MGSRQEEKDRVRALREDRKIKPKYAPGQGGTPVASNNPFQKPNNNSNPFPSANKTNPFGNPTNNASNTGSTPPFGTNTNTGSTPPFGNANRPPFANSGVQPNAIPPRPGAMNGGFGSTPQTPPNQQQPNQTPQATPEDKAFEVMGKMSKTSWNFFTELTKSFREVDSVDWQKSFNRSFILSASVAGIGLVLGIFKHDLWWIAGAGVFDTVITFLANHFITKSAKYAQDLAKRQEPEPEPDPDPQPEPAFTPPPAPTIVPAEPDPEPEPELDIENLFSDDDDDDLDIFADDPEEENIGEDEDSEDDWKSLIDDSEPVAVSTPSVEKDPEEVLSNLDNMDKDMVSRQYIYESMVSAGQTITPDYKKEVDVPDSSDKFDTMDTAFTDVFGVLGIDELEAKHINKYTETLLVDYLYTDRPEKKFKPEDFDVELTQILRKGYKDIKGNEKKFSKTEFVGRQMITKIFKGVSPMISVTDVEKANKDFYLDDDVAMPVILGIDEEGKEVKFDMQKAESIYVAGKPRSGKSFTIRHILTQLLSFTKPTDLNFYIGDVKGASSDYFKLKHPHIKEFESEPLEIINMLKRLVEVESKRRADLFSKAGVIKIDDYHDKYPERTDMPYIYVIIDEMVGLSSELKNLMNASKDAPKYLNIYFSYLEQLVTQLPAYGIRLIAVPHRVTNNYIPKTASDNMMFKVAVRADEELLKETLNISEKKFGYKTTAKGDLSVMTSLVRPDPFYCKSIVPANSTVESDKIFDFQAKFWNKLEHSKHDRDNEDHNSNIDNQDQPSDSQSRGTEPKSEDLNLFADNSDSKSLSDTNGGTGVSFDDLI